MRLEEKIAKILIRRKKTLSIAESCTGGLLSHRLTNVSGSSQFLKISLVAYSNSAKIKFLKVPSAIIRNYGAVSPQTALAMAQGARRLLTSDFGIAITGIAGPTGGTKQKPVGLVYIAIDAKKQSLCRKFLFKGNRLSIKSQSASRALQIFFKFIA